MIAILWLGSLVVVGMCCLEIGETRWRRWWEDLRNHSANGGRGA